MRRDQNISDKEKFWNSSGRDEARGLKDTSSEWMQINLRKQKSKKEKENSEKAKQNKQLFQLAGFLPCICESR